MENQEWPPSAKIHSCPATYPKHELERARKTLIKSIIRDNSAEWRQLKRKFGIPLKLRSSQRRKIDVGQNKDMNAENKGSIQEKTGTNKRPPSPPDCSIATRDIKTMLGIGQGAQDARSTTPADNTNATWEIKRILGMVPDASQDYNRCKCCRE